MRLHTILEEKAEPKQEVKRVSEEPLSLHEGDGLEEGKARGRTIALLRGNR